MSWMEDSMSVKNKSDQRPEQRRYDLKTAAVYLGRGVGGVRQLIWRGELPVIRSGSGGEQSR